MKIGHFDLFGIKRIVVNKNAVWKKIRNRWVKYVGEEAKSGKSELEMHEYLNGMYWAVKKPIPHNGIVTIENKYQLSSNWDTIYVKRNEEETHNESKNNSVSKENVDGRIPGQ